ncbi:MAG: DUF4149 domain-containing protein [Myxococcus sp.]|nr:DUF4149 domain-containing protein [Myxococcus sp.]
MIPTLSRAVEVLTLAYVLGSAVWFFFVQTPVLVKRLGRDRFVPLQMAMVVVLFRTWSVTLGLLLAASLVRAGTLHSLLVLSAALAFVAALLNAVVVVPRAIRAGGRSLSEAQTMEQQQSVAAFAVDGGGASTRVLHRLVVVFVVLMLVGLGPHVAALVTQPTPAPAHDHAAEATPAARPLPPAAPRWKANPETSEGVHAMAALVREALATARPADETATKLDEALQRIFQQCTMTGEAHEALHTFLVPLVGLIPELRASQGEATTATLRKLEAQLARYDERFEG